jgi:hypothetical protein
LIEVTLVAIAATPNATEVNPNAIEITLVAIEVTPNAIEITLVAIEVTPNAIEVTPAAIEVTLETTRVTVKTSKALNVGFHFTPPNPRNHKQRLPTIPIINPIHQKIPLKSP